METIFDAGQLKVIQHHCLEDVYRVLYTKENSDFGCHLDVPKNDIEELLKATVSLVLLVEKHNH